MKTPCSLPRIVSGTAACIMVLRKIELTLSAAPEHASATQPSAISSTFGAVAVALELIIARLVPMGQKQPWNTDGPDGPIQLSDPTVRLEQDLRRRTRTRHDEEQGKGKEGAHCWTGWWLGSTRQRRTALQAVRRGISGTGPASTSTPAARSTKSPRTVPAPP